MTDSGFPFRKIGKQGKWQARKVNDYSDGQERHWPGKPLYRPSSEENYLVLLGTEWVKQDHLDQPAVSYYVDKLPKGYAVFDTDQPGGNQVYKRLFGHPSGRFYDSMVRFLPHFLWLMSGLLGSCECVLCSKPSNKPIIRRNRLPKEPRDTLELGQRRAPREVVATKSDPSTRDSSTAGIATGRVKRDVKQVGAPYAQDEEGTEDVFKKFIKRIYDHQGSNAIVEDIIEKLSLDWRSEHEYDGFGEDILQSAMTRIELQHAFTPRVGELVLWCPNFLDGHYLMLDIQTGEYKFYSFEQKQFHGFPDWRAGVVTEVPLATLQNGNIDFPDLLDLPEKKSALNQTGFRIETLPDPNEDNDKSLSKQYRFVPLRSIRPLSQWQMILRGISEERLHPSIKNSLTCMTTISLVEKFKAAGNWPGATVLCEAIFIGAELFLVGDTVRLASRGPNRRTCTDVLVVDTIRLNLHDIQPEHTLSTSLHLCSSSSITIVGKAYTVDIKRDYRMQARASAGDSSQQISVPNPISPDEVKTTFRPVGTAEYGSWYPMHAPNQRYEVSYDQVLGKLYEADAVRLWTGQFQKKLRKDKGPKHRPSLDFDISGILSGRKYATQADTRMPESIGDALSWYWADTRTEALAVQTFNGLEVGKYHDIRDNATLQSWNNQLRILGGQQVISEAPSFNEHTRRQGRPVGSKVINGKLVLPGDPGYEDAVAVKEGDVATPQRAKPFSQMAGAALVSTDEEGDSDDDSLLVEDSQPKTTIDGELDTIVVEDKQPKHSIKEQIMSGAMHQSIEDDAEAYYDESDIESWLKQPLPPARGGTEESEGGDYDPRKERSTSATQAAKKARAAMSH